MNSGIIEILKFLNFEFVNMISIII